MSKEVANRKKVDPFTLAVCCLAYGGILGYAFGKAQEEKAARARAEKASMRNKLWELEATLFSLQAQLQDKENAHAAG